MDLNSNQLWSHTVIFRHDIRWICGKYLFLKNYGTILYNYDMHSHRRRLRLASEVVVLGSYEIHWLMVAGWVERRQWVNVTVEACRPLCGNHIRGD